MILSEDITMITNIDTIQNIINEFKKSIESYSYKVYDINTKEKVIVIEDSLVLYVGFLTYFEDWYGECNTNFYEKEDYCLKIEELTYNTLSFKFNSIDFINKYKQLTGNDLNCFYLKFFSSNARTIDYRTYKCIERPKLIDKIDKLKPNLLLKKRNDSWDGILYYFVVVEVRGFDNTNGIGVFRTTSKPYSYILTKGRNWIKDGFEAGNYDAVGNEFEQALFSWRGKRLKRKDILENNLSYYYIEKRVKDKNKLWDIANEILENARNGIYDDIERNTYIKPDNRWKTEELVYKLIKKMYKEYNVIYQHRPFFLHTEKGGQMSYDIFISGLNIAIEYQGKQHFEPVDFFGGEEGYKKTFERDKLKRKLSEENGVKLIYINYWEDVTMELIRSKIENVLS